MIALQFSTLPDIDYVVVRNCTETRLLCVILQKNYNNDPSLHAKTFEAVTLPQSGIDLSSLQLTSNIPSIKGMCPAYTMSTRRPSYSRIASVNASPIFRKQSSVSSADFFGEHPPDDTDDGSSDGTQNGIWNTTRSKLTLVSLCLVYFAATASFAILSPFFPGEV